MTGEAPQSSLRETEIAQLLRDLGSWRRDRREAAERALRALGMEAVDPLLQWFEREQRRYKKLDTVTGIFWFCFCILFLVSDNGHNFPFLSDSLGKTLGAIMIVSLVISLPLQLVVRLRARRIRNAVRILIAVEDLRAIGRLCDVLGVYGQQTDAMVVSALTRLLPRLKATDAALISKENQAKLCGRLMTSSEVYGKEFDPEFALAILKALEQVGDEDALPAVEKLAHGSSRHPKKGFLRDAAREILPTLRARLEREHLGRTLLRPACAPDTPAGILLRPAQGAPDTDADRLLRPIERED